MSFSELYSHPGRPLEEHLTGTARIARELAEEKSFSRLAGLPLSPLAATAALCHDVGKATAYFQKYLAAPEGEKEKLRARPETRHGLLSAVCSYFATEEVLRRQGDPESEEGALAPFFAFMVTKKHHGNLDDVLTEVVLPEKKQSILLAQVESIDGDKLARLNEELQKAGLPVELSKDTLRQWVQKIPAVLKAVKRKLRKLKRNQNLQVFLLVNILYSIMLDADKIDAVLGLPPGRKDIPLDSKIVDNYKAGLNFDVTWLNSLREKAYRETLNRKIDPAQRIFSLNLPTGLGKTLTVLAFAFKLKSMIKDQAGFSPRLIYSLPFLSIIDQNAIEFEKVLESAGILVDSHLLLKHHHLAELYYQKDQDEFEPDQAKILIEGWNAEIIITTFVQLFHTMFSHRNSALRKFHRLADSIIILDEVQSLPAKYWLLVQKFLEAITGELNCRIIFVTATQPHIFPGGETIPLVDKEKYFAQMARVTVKPHLEENISLEELAAGVNPASGKSHLFIMNTISAARELYQLLVEKTGREDLIYLSTHVVPRERQERIALLREGKGGICVTTQLVEAGVDIDFDVVYRDLAPLDCINQAAGRCNRHGLGEGEVHVISLADERGRTYSSYVYDPLLLEITRQILSREKRIKEGDFLRLIEDYYAEIARKKSGDESREVLEALYRLRYQSDSAVSVADFRLIEYDYPKLDTFIELDERAQRTWQRYTEIKEIKNLFDRRLAFAAIKSDFYRYVISIPLHVENLPPEVEGFRYVNRAGLSEYYHPFTGYICSGVTAIW